MTEPSAARAWADTHGIVLSAAPLETASTCDYTWQVEARTPRGCLAVAVTTDGPEPDPFDHLFGVWAYETPDDGEYAAAAEVLGPDALVELAELLGWL